MDLLVQLAVIVAFVLGIVIVAGLSVLFLVLPLTSDRDGVVLDRDEVDDAMRAARRHPAGSRVSTML